MEFHIAEARRHLDLAARDPRCGACRELLGEEVDHLDLFSSLSGKVLELTTAQDATTRTFVEGNERADRRLAETGLAPPPAERSGLGLSDMARDMWRSRVRVVDVLSVGQRR